MTRYHYRCQQPIDLQLYICDFALLADHIALLTSPPLRRRPYSTDNTSSPLVNPPSCEKNSHFTCVIRHLPVTLFALKPV